MKAWFLLLVLAWPGTVAAQEGRERLETVAETTRQRWERQDAPGLVEGSPQLVIQLPGADPSAPVQRRQAARLLRDFFARSEEVETVLHEARELEDGRGMVELRRRYRVQGTQEVRDQILLLSYRRSGRGWTLVELRVSR